MTGTGTANYDYGNNRDSYESTQRDYEGYYEAFKEVVNDASSTLGVTWKGKRAQKAENYLLNDCDPIKEQIYNQGHDLGVAGTETGAERELVEEDTIRALGMDPEEYRVSLDSIEADTSIFEGPSYKELQEKYQLLSGDNPTRDGQNIVPTTPGEHNITVAGENYRVVVDENGNIQKIYDADNKIRYFDLGTKEERWQSWFDGDYMDMEMMYRDGYFTGGDLLMYQYICHTGEFSTWTMTNELKTITEQAMTGNMNVNSNGRKGNDSDIPTINVATHGLGWFSDMIAGVITYNSANTSYGAVAETWQNCQDGYSMFQELMGTEVWGSLPTNLQNSNYNLVDTYCKVAEQTHHDLGEQMAQGWFTKDGLLGDLTSFGLGGNFLNGDYNSALNLVEDFVTGINGNIDQLNGIPNPFEFFGMFGE